MNTFFENWWWFFITILWIVFIVFSFLVFSDTKTFIYQNRCLDKWWEYKKIIEYKTENNYNQYDTCIIK